MTILGMSVRESSRSYFWKVAILIASVFLYLACNRNPIQASETRMLRVIQRLKAAEDTYHSDHGRFANLMELGPSGANLVGDDLSAGLADNYRILIVISPTGYALTARPTTASEGTYRSFYSDETGVIRYGFGPTAPTRASNRIDGKND